MLRTRVVLAMKALALAVVGAVAIYTAMTGADGNYSMLLGLAGVLALAGSALLVTIVYLE